MTKYNLLMNLEDKHKESFNLVTSLIKNNDDTKEFTAIHNLNKVRIQLLKSIVKIRIELSI